MSRDRYLELISYLKQGYKLNLKTFVITNPKGRQLKISKHGDRVPVVSIKSKQYSITEVIGVWMGMDVIDNYCIMKDGNKQNYHPGNLIWTNRETALSFSQAKLDIKTIKKIKKINQSELSKRDGTKGKLAEQFGISKRHLYAIVHGERLKNLKLNSSIN
jgi:hypothetical protein